MLGKLLHMSDALLSAGNTKDESSLLSVYSIAWLVFYTKRPCMLSGTKNCCCSLRRTHSPGLWESEKFHEKGQWSSALKKEKYQDEQRGQQTAEAGVARLYVERWGIMESCKGFIPGSGERVCFRGKAGSDYGTLEVKVSDLDIKWTSAGVGPSWNFDQGVCLSSSLKKSLIWQLFQEKSKSCTFEIRAFIVSSIILSVFLYRIKTT